MQIKLVTLLTVTAIFCIYSPAEAVDLKYAGSTTVQMGFMYDAAALYKKIHNKRISIMGGSSSAGVHGVAMGSIDLGGASRELTEKEKAKGIVSHVIAWDAIAVIANKGNPINDLTLQQLKEIFTGDTRNWKHVGGPDASIAVITSHEGSATKEVINKIVMQKRPWSPNAIAVNSTRDEVDQVLANPGAIGAVSVSFADSGKVKIIKVDGIAPTAEHVINNKYKISRPLNLLTAGQPTGETRKFIDFMLSPLGQDIVSKKFIPAQ